MIALPAAALGALIGGMHLILEELQSVHAEMKALRWQCDHHHQSVLAELQATLAEIRSMRWQHNAEPRSDGEQPTTIQEL